MRDRKYDLKRLRYEVKLYVHFDAALALEGSQTEMFEIDGVDTGVGASVHIRQ